MRGIAKLATVLGGVSIWACAKANDSKLIYDGEERGGHAGAAGAAARGGTNAGKGGSSGASAGSGGSVNSGGSAGSTGKSSGGSGGRGGPSTSGGSGGSSAGGKASNGGSTSTGGSAASSDGCERAIDPDVLARAKLVLHYIAQDTKASSRSVEMRLFLENKTGDAIPLAPVEVRYWMTSEPHSRDLHHYYEAAVTSSVSLKFVEDGADSYVEATFDGGTLPANTSDLNSTEFQIKVEASSNFDQTDDYSFDPCLTRQPAAPHDKITVYVQNRLVWGCEPSGACPSNGEGGAGGEGGGGGQGGASGASGEGGSSPAEGGQGGEPAASGGQGGDGGDAGAAGAVSN